MDKFDGLFDAFSLVVIVAIMIYMLTAVGVGLTWPYWVFFK